MTRSPFVTIDLETRSACDLRKRGGHLYAADPTTRLLTVAWHVDGQYHLWLPGVTHVPQALADTHLTDCTLHLGANPAPLIPTDRPWVGHNAFGFDALVWWRQHLPQPPKWIDSQALAQAFGLPGGLDKIGTRLWGDGKYKAGSKELKRASAATGLYDCDAVNVPVGQTVLVGRYNVQDVRLTVDLMDYLHTRLRIPAHELALLAEHRAVNDRGVRIDTGLVAALYRLSNEAVDDAVEEIKRLTGGLFASVEDLRKRTKVLAWVKDQGAMFGDSLRREVVAQWIEGVRGGGAEDEGDDEPQPERGPEDGDGDPIGNTTNLMLVARVLELRQAAMRITGAKLEAAGNRVDALGIARGLFHYWGAHTGRWAGRGIQVQNLPRPKEDVPVWELVALYEERKEADRTRIVAAGGNPDDATGDLPLPAVKHLLLRANEAANVKRVAAGGRPKPPNTPDDAASALIRSLFLPHRGDPVLMAADLAAIEARVLAWLAGEEWLMETFRTGGDPYIGFCERVTRERITKKDPRRQVWKVILLGAGYQLGPDKLAVYAASSGVDLTVAGLTPQTAIDAYRNAHSKIAGDVAGVTKDGREFRRGGLWWNLQEGAIAAVQGNREVQVGRVLFIPDRGNLLVRLPSGRHLVYQMVRLHQQTKWGRDFPYLVYASPRWLDTYMYGGKWCWGGDTLILTDTGPRPIRDITPTDHIWDGQAWVTSGGSVFNGIKETGRWLDQSVTGDHSILDGNSWSALTRVDAGFSVRSLGYAAASMPSKWSHLAAGKVSSADAFATAVRRVRSTPGASFEALYHPAPAAGGSGEGPSTRGTPNSSRPDGSLPSGSTGTRAWSPAAPTPHTGRTPITAGGGLPFTPSGWPTDAPSSPTPSPYPAGTKRGWTSTGGETTGITNPEIFVWCPGPSTARTAVYDILNCGPRNRYTVVTPYGCVIAHNCENITQAVASDFIRHALVLNARDGIRSVLHVHDEIVASGHPEELPAFMRNITTVPEWAAGFPLEAEGGALPRYAKTPPEGDQWKEQVWRNGERVK